MISENNKTLYIFIIFELFFFKLLLHNLMNNNDIQLYKIEI